MPPLDPENPAVLDTLSKALEADTQLGKALAAQKRAVEQAPEAYGMRMRLASLALQTGDKALAKSELMRLQALGPKFKAQDEVARMAKSL